MTTTTKMAQQLASYVLEEDVLVKYNHDGTVDVESFAGLNISGFNPTEVFAEILSCCLATSAYYLV